jgi:hypothetical protein
MVVPFYFEMGAHLERWCCAAVQVSSERRVMNELDELEL